MHIYFSCIFYCLSTCIINSVVGVDQILKIQTELRYPLHKPIVFNYPEECLDDEKYSAWVFFDNLLITGGINEFEEIQNVNLTTCLNKCQEKRECAAVSKLKTSNEKTSSCFMFLFDSLANNYYSNYSTYAKVNCKFTKKPLSLNRQLNLPITLSPSNACDESSKLILDYCSSLLWYMQDNINVNIPPFHRIKNIETISCQQECIKMGNLCKAITMEIGNQFEMICNLYNVTVKDNNNKLTQNNVIYYELRCCDAVVEAEAGSDLLLIYRPVHLCKWTNYQSTGQICQTKFWLVEERVIMKGDFAFDYDLVNVQTCLKTCQEMADCIAVSIDFYKDKCLFYTERNDKIYSHSKWTTYSLQCCIDI